MPIFAFITRLFVMIYSSGAVGSDWPWERWMAQIRSLVSRHLCHPVLRKQTIRSCSARTFWKVAVFPCAGVLAPVCSCWHSTASFSISVTTEDFSSSTSWNREKSGAGDAFQDKREGAIHVCVCVWGGLRRRQIYRTGFITLLFRYYLRKG